MQKRIMWFAIFLLAICNKIAAEDKVYISDFSISPGETRLVSVMLDNEDAYVGFQFDVYLPEGFSITSCTKSDRIPDGTNVLGNQRTDDTGSFYRVIGASLAGKAITGNSGDAIATLTVTADASVALNDYTGYLCNIKASKANGTGLTKDEETFTITVKDPEAYAALSSDNKTLTFYYDSQKASRSGTKMTVLPSMSSSQMGWNNLRNSINKVIFDDSFKEYKELTSTSNWFYNFSNLTAVEGLSNLNTDNVTYMISMFEKCSSLTTLDVSNFKTDNVTNMKSMFSGCSKLVTLDLSKFNTEKVTDMSLMFSDCRKLTSLNVSLFKTSNVTTMRTMFYNCTSLTTLDVSNFDTGNVTDMVYMFYNCSNLIDLDVSGFNTGKVTDMSEMFQQCESLTTLDVSHFNTENVTDMSYMFFRCSKVTNLDVSNFNTAKVTDMSGMFYVCSKITSLDLSNFNTAKVTDMSEMFLNCNNLKTIYAGDGWTTEAVTNSTSMFADSPNLIGGGGTTYKAEHTDAVYARIDEGPNSDNPGYFTDKREPYAVLSSDSKTLTFYYNDQKEARDGMDVGPFSSDVAREWHNQRESITTVIFDNSFVNYTSLTSTAFWFEGCSNLISIESISNLKTDNVTNMFGMFSGCSSLTEVDVSGFNTDNVTNMFGMFNDCSGLTSLNVSRFNTENVTIMDDMFSGCSSLKELDVSGFNTENVTNMFGMFYGCSGLTSLDVSRFDTKNVTSMSGMFMDCSSLSTIDLSYFNTSNVTYTSGMFQGCSGLTSLDLSNFATEKVTSIHYMFYGCSNLATIYVGSGWNIEAITTSDKMFEGCTKLVGGAGTVYDADHTDYTYAHIDGGEENPGYLTKQKVLEQVKTPTFSFDDRNLILATETEEATILYEIKEYDNSLDNDSIAKIAAKMTISDTASVYKDPIQIDKDVIVLARGTKEGMVNSNDTLLIYPYTEWEILMYNMLPMGEQTLKDAEGNDMIPEDLLEKLRAAIETAIGFYNDDYRITMTRDEVDRIIYYIDNLINEIKMYKVVTITAKDYTREYGAANPKFEYTVEGAEISGTPTITCAATDTTSVGTYPITITYTKADSESTLNVTCVEGTLTITKAPLTITAKSYTIKRGEAIPTLEATYTGFKNKETEAVLTKAPTLSTTAKSDSEAGVYDITVSGAAAKNYDIEYENGTLTITDEVTVTAKNYTRMYGEANPKFDYTSEGATLSGKPMLSCEATATSPVGTYDIVVAQGSITNREVTYVYGTLTITKAPLTITAKDYTIKQGKPLPTFEVEYSGFKNKETDTVFTTKPIVSTTATSNSEPGTYDITVSGAEADNYEMTYVSGKLTITKRTENFDGVVLTVDKGGVIEDAFEYGGGKAEVAKTIAAVVWNDSTELKAEKLDGISNPNLLIYVSDEKLAPSGFNNVVINGVAKNITLTDGDTGNYNFYVPQEFKADNISYSREFKQTTQDGISRGWEGIVLPFTVETFTHEEHGNISPFGNDACEYHFWLRQPTKDGVVSAKTIEANKPYIISMPNSEEYEPEFNQAGWIKFASANAKVPVTETEGVWLGDSAQIAPTFLEVEQSPDIYVLNVGDSIQGHPEGSIFVSNYRKVRPFEVYTFHEFSRSGSRFISLSSLFGGNNGSTDMGVVTVETHADVWYDLNGRRLQGKPTKSGLYIHNGKKEFIRP